MKKLLLVKTLFVCCLVLSSISSSLQAQTFKAAVVGGVNLSQLDGDYLAGFHKIGLNGGLRVSADISERLSLSTEFLFSQQGASSTTNDLLGAIIPEYDKIKLQFVEVPLMLNYSDWKILASGGFSYGRLASYEVTNLEKEDITDSVSLNENIVSIVLGASVFITEDIALNVRWSRSLNSLKDSVLPSGEKEKMISRNIGIRLYYFL